MGNRAALTHDQWLELVKNLLDDGWGGDGQGWFSPTK